MNSKTATRRRIPTRIYQLHVELKEMQPRIWRQLWVADTLTLAKLDRVIQAAMGWTNSHLHEFEIDGTRYGMADNEWPQDQPVLDDKRHRLSEVLDADVGVFLYTYDFGDNWQHTVTVEKRLDPEERINTWPICLAGENACPPEDVGGIGGYMEFLEAIRNPLHEEHVAMWQWCGGPFDPNGFDVNAANAAIRKLR